MILEDLYFKFQKKLFRYEEILEQFKERDKYQKLLENDLNVKYKNLRVFRRNVMKFTADEIVSQRNRITSKTKREGIIRKTLKLSEDFPENKYVYSHEISEEDRRNRISYYITEYESVNLKQILEEHTYFYNLNLPYRNLYELMSLTALYITDNGNNRKETDSINNIYYHNEFLNDVNSYINQQILGIFNNPIGQRLYTILNDCQVFKWGEVADYCKICECLGKSELEEYVKCLVILKLPWDVRIINLI